VSHLLNPLYTCRTCGLDMPPDRVAGHAAHHRERLPEEARDLLRALDPAQVTVLLAWFCRDCGRYVEGSPHAPTCPTQANRLVASETDRRVIDRAISRGDQQVDTEGRPFSPDWVTHPGAHIREMMDAVGVGVEELAVRAGIGIVQLEGLLRGITELTPEVAEAVAQVLATRSNRPLANYVSLLLRLEEMFRQGLAAGKVWHERPL